MKNTRRVRYLQLLLCISCIMILMIGGNGAHAFPSFTASASLYQGVELTPGMETYDPRMLIVRFGFIERLAQFFNSLDLMAGSPSPVEVHVTFDMGTDFPAIVPEGRDIGVIVLDETTLHTFGDALLASFDLSTGGELLADAGDTVILITAEGDYAAFGDLLYDPVKQSVHFSGKQAATIPEASTLALLGVGLLLLGRTAGVVGKKRIWGNNDRDCL
jgi:hypothetical protein